MRVHEERTKNRKVHKLSSSHALVTECGLRPLVWRDGIKRKNPLKCTMKWNETKCKQCLRTEPQRRT